MTFEWPLALLALLVVPALVVLYVMRERRRVDFAARFTTPGLLPNLVDSAPGWRRHLPLAVFLVALAAMIVGVARPRASVSVKREEATVIVAIDSSLSMSSRDVRPSRLVAAQNAARAFVDELPKKFRVGVIGFSGRAYVAVPPTEDRALVYRALKSLHPGQGTALGDAVALATKLAQRERDSSGKIPPTSVLVISDGAQKSGRTAPDVAAQQARNLHIPVYSVVVGTQDGVITVPLAGGFQAQLRVPPDPGTLQRVAQTSGGRFFDTLSVSRLKQVYENLGSRLGRRKESREVGDLFAGGSAAFLLFGGALSALWFRRVP
jgi:Ca-activated chloride channel family protein